MEIRCIRPFGSFEPGDTVEVPDEAVFDAYYFEREAPKEKPEPKPEPRPEPDKGKGE